MTTHKYDTITISNTIQSGAAFAIKHGTGESCYIPATVMFMTSAKPGDVVEAILVENPSDFVRDRTPYMVRFIKPKQMDLPGFDPKAPAAPAAPVFNRDEVERYVRTAMKAGGVWTVGILFQEYMQDDKATREDNPQAYNAISATLRAMFDADECAKWSMWTKKSQSKPGREWFSCYPQNVDVAEWEPVDAE